jgi:hypothetical protein
VSTPEVLEMANTFEAEMSQLEGARKIYAAQGVSISNQALLSACFVAWQHLSKIGNTLCRVLPRVEMVCPVSLHTSFPVLFIIGCEFILLELINGLMVIG